MKYHELQLHSSKNKKRVGRGIAAGQGKTAGRGTKGQKSRTGSKRRPGFEGGQNPLMQRLPKMPGFHSIRPKAETINTNHLNQIKGVVVSNQTLAAAGLVSSPHAYVKLICRGELNKKLTVRLQAASITAIAMIQKQGGSFERVPRVGRAKTSGRHASSRTSPKQ